MTTALWILLGIGILIALAIIGVTVTIVVTIKTMPPTLLERYSKGDKK